MVSHEEAHFGDLVASALPADRHGARTLWIPLGQQFESDGPDAVKEYLEAQRQQLVGDVEKLLSHVTERIE